MMKIERVPVWLEDLFSDGFGDCLLGEREDERVVGYPMKKHGWSVVYGCSRVVALKG